MARPLCIETPGGLYHVPSCGNHQKDIFLNEEDRRSWLEIFAHHLELLRYVLPNPICAKMVVGPGGQAVQSKMIDYKT
jgi:hypothetical protein